MTITFRLRGDKDKKNIIIDLSAGRGKRLKISTGWQISQSQWNEAKNAPKASPQNKMLALQLKELALFVEQAYNARKGEEISADWLKKQIAIFRGEVVPSAPLVDFIRQEVERYARNGQASSAKKFQSVGNSVASFQNKKRKTFLLSEAGGVFFADFIRFLEGRKISSVTIKNYVKLLRVLLRNAKRQGLEVQEVKDPPKIKIPKKPAEEIVFLSFEEIAQIKALDLSEALPLENARKWLILGCDIGQRVSDLLRVTPEMMFEKNGGRFIRLQQIKTGITVTIPLFDDALSVLTGDFPFPVPQEHLLLGIRELCKRAGIDTPTLKTQRKSNGQTGEVPKYEAVGTHTMRRSFASNYYGIISTPLLKNITGHTTEEMLLRYIGVGSSDTSEWALEEYQKYKRRG